MPFLKMRGRKNPGSSPHREPVLPGTSIILSLLVAAGFHDFRSYS